VVMVEMVVVVEMMVVLFISLVMIQLSFCQLQLYI
jgi:hypothetical protein